MDLVVVIQVVEALVIKLNKILNLKTDLFWSVFIIHKISASYLCVHPAQQHGRRIPPFSFESAFSIRIIRVSSFFADVTQHIHSLRARGVISSHVSSTDGVDVSISRKSAGNL
jgi:hypothetical protein